MRGVTTVLMPHLTHGGGAGWNRSGMTHRLPDFRRERDRSLSHQRLGKASANDGGTICCLSAIRQTTPDHHAIVLSHSRRQLLGHGNHRGLAGCNAAACRRAVHRVSGTERPWCSYSHWRANGGQTDSAAASRRFTRSPHPRWRAPLADGRIVRLRTNLRRKLNGRGLVVAKEETKEKL
jgi:hypothetical protein